MLRSATVAGIRVNRKVYMGILMIGGMGVDDRVYKGIGEQRGSPGGKVYIKVLVIRRRKVYIE